MTDRSLRLTRLAPTAALLLAAAGGLLASTVHGDPAARGDSGAALIGKAGTIELTESDVRRVVAALPDNARAQVLASAPALEQLVRAELVRRLLLTEAKAKGFDRDGAVTAEIDRLRDEVVVRLWLERAAKVPADYPSDAELAQAYEAAHARAAAASDYHLAQIFVSAPDGAPSDKLAAAMRKAVEVQGKLAGGDFAALAKAYSEHAESAAKGGDLGTLSESRLLPEVRGALATMKVGDVAGPLKTAQGLHFVRLIGKRPVAAPPLSEVRDALVQALRQQRAGELQQRYLADLAAKAPPSVNEVELAKFKERQK